jgi:hypothetical protein
VQRGQDILNKQPVEPHKGRSFLNRRATAFEEGKAEIIEVYVAAECCV